MAERTNKAAKMQDGTQTHKQREQIASIALTFAPHEQIVLAGGRSPLDTAP